MTLITFPFPGKIIAHLQSFKKLQLAIARANWFNQPV